MVYGCGVDHIDKQTLEISSAGDEIYSSMQELADELPDHSPRFVLLSYPLTLVLPLLTHAFRPSANGADSQPSGRVSVPYVMIYYMPVTCNAELRMLYAGAKELMRNEAEVGSVVEIADAEELAGIEGMLGGGS